MEGAVQWMGYRSEHITHTTYNTEEPLMHSDWSARGSFYLRFPSETIIFPTVCRFQKISKNHLFSFFLSNFELLFWEKRDPSRCTSFFSCYGLINCLSQHVWSGQFSVFTFSLIHSSFQVSAWIETPYTSWNWVERIARIHSRVWLYINAKYTSVNSLI